VEIQLCSILIGSCLPPLPPVVHLRSSLPGRYPVVVVVVVAVVVAVVVELLLFLFGFYSMVPWRADAYSSQDALWNRTEAVP